MDYQGDSVDHALTVSGNVLSTLLETKVLSDLLFQVARRCKSVLCCRVTPRQKALVVELVKTRHAQVAGELPVSLAIGDGANDVAMITAAHIGIGLSGKEGTQAARAADFALGEFRLLERLVFVHGHESYRRNAVLVNYNFYKNMLLVLPPFLYGLSTVFSGQPFYEQMLYQLYNVVFTSAPIVVFALFDREEEDLHRLQTNPLSYIPGRRKTYFNGRVFLLWMSASTLQAVVLTYVAFAALGGGFDASAGGASPSSDLWSTGAVVFLLVILGANMTLASRMNDAYPFSIAALIASVSMHPLALFAMDVVIGSSFLRGAFTVVYGSGGLRCLLAVNLALALHVFVGEPLLQRTETRQFGKATRDSQESSYLPVATAVPDPSTEPLVHGKNLAMDSINSIEAGSNNRKKSTFDSIEAGSNMCKIVSRKSLAEHKGFCAPSECSKTRRRLSKHGSQEELDFVEELAFGFSVSEPTRAMSKEVKDVRIIHSAGDLSGT